MDRTAILNGFGRSLGDGIIGLQALSVAIAAGAVPPNPVLFRLPGLPAVTQGLYRAASGLASVQDLQWANAAPGTVPDGAAVFSRVVELRDFAFDPAFRGVAMIDFFLARLGVDPGQVAPSRKRNAWLAKLVTPAPPPVPPGYVLLCPDASMPLRCMPGEVHAAALAWLRAHAGRAVLSQAGLPQEDSLEGLCGLVAGAALVVSTDTAMVHLADAFGVPCLAFMTTHRPEWRARDYPLCRAVHLPSSLPPALEFARSEDDLLAARAAWFPDGAGLKFLYRELAASLARLPPMAAGR